MLPRGINDWVGVEIRQGFSRPGQYKASELRGDRFRCRGFLLIHWQEHYFGGSLPSYACALLATAKVLSQAAWLRKKIAIRVNFESSY
jgi:hypothetical protein